jgi:hypothetical protein
MHELHTVVVGDPRLKLLVPRHRRFCRVRDDVHQRDAFEADHLLEVDVAAIIAVGVLQRKRKVGAIRIGFEEVAPRRLWPRIRRDVQEDGVCHRLEDRVGCVFESHVGREARWSEGLAIERDHQPE